MLAVRMNRTEHLELTSSSRFRFDPVASSGGVTGDGDGALDPHVRMGAPETLLVPVNDGRAGGRAGIRLPCRGF